MHLWHDMRRAIYIPAILCPDVSPSKIRTQIDASEIKEVFRQQIRLTLILPF